MASGGRTGDTDLIKRINKHKIISALRPNERRARIEIAEETDLSPATVTVLTQELLRDGLLIELQGEANGAARNRGRPRVSLALNPEAAFVVGTKISMHQLAVSVTNFVGEVLHNSTRSVSVQRESPERVADLMEELVKDAAREVGVPVAKMSGLGIGVPGFIDQEAGVCHWTPVFGKEAIPFRDMMRDRLGIPVAIDNDANLVTLAEQWFGRGQNVTDFVVVTVEHGIGMGVVVGGQLYRGRKGFGPELGHTKIHRDGVLCRCGQRGCVEAYVADYAIVRDARQLMDLPERNDPIGHQEIMADLADRARKGDAVCRGLFENAGQVLGMAVANAVNILNPQMVVLSGSGIQAYDLFETPFLEAFKDNSLSVEQHDTPVKLGEWDDRVWARGAAALVLESLYEAPTARPSPGVN